MDTSVAEKKLEKITLNEKILLEVLRHFNFLRKYHFIITQISIYGRTHYIVYSSNRKQLYIEWDRGITIELRTGNLFKYKSIDVSYIPKQYGILLDTGYVFEQIAKYADFIKKNASELLC